MTQYLFRNVQLLDPARDRLLGGHEVLVEGERIREVSDRPLQARGAMVIDGGGRTLMPGLIDCHVHVYLSEVNIRNLEHVPLTLMTARAAVLEEGLEKTPITEHVEALREQYDKLRAIDLSPAPAREGVFEEFHDGFRALQMQIVHFKKAKAMRPEGAVP